MKGRSMIGGKPDKARRHKATPKRPRSAIAVRNRATSTSSEKEIALLTRERDEALEQQKATTEVLRVISSSPGQLAPVFQTMLENATRICEAKFGFLWLAARDGFRAAAFHNVPPELAARRQHDQAIHFGPDTPMGRLIETRQLVHVADIRSEPAYVEGFRPMRELADIGGGRTLLVVPMLKENELVGAFAIYRQEVRPFTDKHISLVQNFAAQAVIAIENARLLEELQKRTDDLSESLQQQTATAEVLGVIASSPTDVKPVLEAIVESACRLCEANDAYVALKDGDDLVFQAHYGSIPVAWRRRQINRQLPSGRAVVEGKPVHVRDLWASEGDEFPDGREIARRDGTRTILTVPLMREGEAIGTIILRRTEVQPFADQQIGLLKTFADQAVIAIGNVRLFDEVQARTRELATSLDDLRAAQDRLIQTEKLASLGQLTAGIAHEIKNPLNFVNNFSALSVELTDELNDLLKHAKISDEFRKETNELTGLLKDNLGKVVQHGKRADSIVKNMLLHSREGSGERRSADINALVGESLNLAYHGARAEKAGFSITLKQDFDPEAGVLDLYPQEMTRALLNLISNGFYAATRRKAEAGDDIFEPILSAATRNHGKTVEIRIRDNGDGIPLGIREKIFNPFFTTKPTGVGTGLGLSMTHDIIVKQHGGRIDVETEPGVFTEFIITLPRDNGTAIGEKSK
jgi:two-component system NtrC family sensor kinase